MNAPNSSQQAEVQVSADKVATAAATPLARFVPTASAVSDQTVDEWVEREQRRGRSSIKIGAVLLVAVSLASLAFGLLL
jgi:hypothetical protein